MRGGKCVSARLARSKRRGGALTVLRAQLHARDAFLSKLASTLRASTGELERAARAAPQLSAAVSSALLEHVALVRELQIVASPSEPVRVRLRKHDLCAWLARFCEARQARAAQHKLALTFERAGALPCRFDEDLLASMLEELLSNAMKYRRKRPVMLHAARSGECAVITVTNHGPWIGPEPAFGRFQRGETRRSVQGFGIGLWLTRRLAEAHGGAFEIRAGRTQTHAMITLPATDASGGARTSYDSPRPDAASIKRLRAKAALFHATLLER